MLFGAMKKRKAGQFVPPSIYFRIHVSRECVHIITIFDCGYHQCRTLHIIKPNYVSACITRLPGGNPRLCGPTR